MDIFSHALYGGIAVGRRSKRDYITAFLFGMAPDLLSIGLFVLLAILGIIERPPQITGTLYNATHSLIIYALIFGLLWVWGKRNFAKLTLAWPLHILIDIPSHSAEFYPTHFLWPVSDFYFDGISWGESAIFIPNLIVLGVLYTVWYIRKKRSGHIQEA